MSAETRPTVLYHATKPEYVACILEEGLRPGQNGGDPFYVYTALDMVNARAFGSVLCTVHVAPEDDLRTFEDEDSSIPVWQIVIPHAIPPERITVHERGIAQIGKAVGEKWSELPGNEHLSERGKALVDDPEFQRSNLEALEAVARGERGIPWDEFERKHFRPKVSRRLILRNLTRQSQALGMYAT